MGGKVQDGIMHIADWYSLNMWPWLMGDEEESPRTGFVLSDYGVMEGEFKYLQGRMLYSVWGEAVWPHSETPSQEELRDTILDCAFFGCLFNVVDDPEERIDVKGLYPELTQKLKTKLTFEKSKFWRNAVEGAN